MKRATVRKMVEKLSELSGTAANDMSICSELYEIVKDDLIVEVEMIDIEEFAKRIMDGER